MPRKSKTEALDGERDALLYRIIACVDAGGKKISEMPRDQQLQVLQEILFANMLDERAVNSTAAVKQYLEVMAESEAKSEAQPRADAAQAMMERLRGGRATA